MIGIKNYNKYIPFFQPEAVKNAKKKKKDWTHRICAAGAY